MDDLKTKAGVLSIKLEYWPSLRMRLVNYSLFVTAILFAVGVLAPFDLRIAAQTAGAVTLRGAGSTFAAPLYLKWTEQYLATRGSVSISYDAVGSGEGVRRFLADAIDFAGSDEILTDAENAQAGGAIMVPVTAGMVVIAYNVPGVTGELKLPRDVYVDIFAGVIRQWDDPRIVAANRGVTFPHSDIVIVARQDGSGTTAAFTRHLDAVGPTWRAKGMRVGKLISWPTGVALAPGNEGGASKIRATAGSIGYVEFWYAQRFGLAMAVLQNKAGKFITPAPASGDLALSGRVALVKQLDQSVADPVTPGAYPIRLSAGCSFIRPIATKPKRRCCVLSPSGHYLSRLQALPLSLATCRSPPT